MTAGGAEHLELRPVAADDVLFLAEMLAEAAAWRPGAQPLAPAEILVDPAIARYLRGWPREGDEGMLAVEAGGPVGAAWYRLLRADDAGYGYVDDETPEITIAVRPAARGCGVGGRLLLSLLEVAAEHGLRQVSLSVEVDNPALRLYRRLGFQAVGVVGNARTMVRDLASAGKDEPEPS